MNACIIIIIFICGSASCPKCIGALRIKVDVFDIHVIYMFKKCRYLSCDQTNHIIVLVL